MTNHLKKYALDKKPCFSCGKIVSYTMTGKVPWVHKAPCGLRCIGGDGCYRDNQHRSDCAICAAKKAGAK